MVRDPAGFTKSCLNSYTTTFRWRLRGDGPKPKVRLRPFDFLGGQELVVIYEFSLSDDGPYTGRSAMPSDGTDLTSINESLRIGKEVAVRYRRDDPSVNKLDRSVWQNLQGL